MPRRRSATSSRRSLKRLPRRDLSYTKILTVAKAVLVEHLQALRFMRPQKPGEDYKEWQAEMDKLVGLIPVQQAEFVRKCVKDLHELSKDAGADESTDIERLSKGEIESAMSALLGTG